MNWTLQRRRPRAVIAAVAMVAMSGPVQAEEFDLFDSLFNDEPAYAAADDASSDPAQPARGETEMAPVIDVDRAEAEHEALARTQPRGRFIEEIVVTAQKREEAIQDVPLSITAFSADMLEARGIIDHKDLQLITPGLQYGEMAGYSMIFIRGVGSDAFQATVDSSVATYIDGVYVPYTSHQAQALGSIEQVEILKGPQGTLFGRNTVGGAINVTTRKPGDTFEASLFAEGGNFSRLNTKAYVSGPLLDSLSVAVSGLYNTRDSYWDRLPDDGVEYRKYEDIGGRFALRWQPAQWFEFDATYYKLSHESSDSLAGTLTSASLLGELAGLPTNDEPWKTGANPDVGIDFDLDMYAGTALVRLPWLDFKSISGWQDMINFAHYDYDSTEVTLIDFFAWPQFARAFTQEVQLLSNDASPGWWRWIIGGYYEKSHKGFGGVPVRVPLQSLALGFLGDFGQSLHELLTNLPGVPLDVTARVTLQGSVRTTAYAVFGQTTLDLGDRFGFTLGVRYSTEERSIGNAGVNATVEGVAGLPLPDLPLLRYAEQVEKYSDVSPRATIEFKPFSGTLLYLTYGEGFKAGNFNAINLTLPPQSVEPEKIRSYEAGWKSDLFDQRVRLNLAAFRNEVTDGQIQFISLLSGGLVAFENASAYTINGADAEFTWSITDGLVFNAVGTYMKGSYDDFVGSGFNENSGLLQRNIDFSGNETVRTPRYTATAALYYFFELGRFDWEIGGDMYYNSGFYYNPANTIEEDPYRIYSARLSVLHRRSNLRASLWGRNLSNEIYTMQKFEHDFGVTTIYAPRRTYGLTLQWDYGRS